jgi:hypothetical protein
LQQAVFSSAVTPVYVIPADARIPTILSPTVPTFIILVFTGGGRNGEAPSGKTFSEPENILLSPVLPEITSPKSMKLTYRYIGFYTLNKSMASRQNGSACPRLDALNNNFIMASGKFVTYFIIYLYIMTAADDFTKIIKFFMPGSRPAVLHVSPLTSRHLC